MMEDWTLWQLESWLKTIERKFNVLNIRTEYMADFATQILIDNSLIWLEGVNYVQDMHNMTWEVFKEISGLN